MSSILQDWVAELGLRHQGVLLAAVRGCDTETRHGPSKLLSRCYRAEILNAHAGDPRKSKSFIEKVPIPQLKDRMVAVLDDHDSLPHHFFMHLVHAAEIVGYCHPDPYVGEVWVWFYFAACNKLHMNPETMQQLDERLNADEDSFKKAQDVPPPPEW